MGWEGRRREGRKGKGRDTFSEIGGCLVEVVEDELLQDGQQDGKLQVTHHPNQLMGYLFLFTELIYDSEGGGEGRREGR